MGEKNLEPLALNLEQAAALLGVHRQTLARKLVAGEIPARRFGKRWCLSRKVLEDWLVRGDPVQKSK